MTNTKLYKILSRFDKPKLNRLKKFIHSPYFNTNQQFTNLFDLMYKIVRNADKKGVPEKEEIWARLYDKPYSDIRFRRICNELLKLIEKFIGMEYYQDTPLMEWTNQIRAVQKNGYEELYNSIESKLELEFDRSVDQSAEYHLFKYWFQEVNFIRQNNNANYLNISNLEETIYQLDAFYIAEKIRNELNIESKKRFVEYTYENPLINELIHLLDDNKYDNLPIIKLYFLLLNAYKDLDQTSWYHQLKNAIQVGISKVPLNHSRSILEFTCSYCVRKIKKGNEAFSEELFFWYQFGLSNDLLLDNSTIDKPSFKNIVSIALRTGHADWAEEFIYEYGNCLPNSIQENEVTFNLAQVEFAKKEFSNVLILLNQIRFEDIVDNLHSRCLIMASYYELDEHEALDYYTDSFISYLNRKRNIFNEERRNSYRKLVYLVKRLSKTKMNLTDIDSTVQAVNEHEGLPWYLWLTTKVEELRNMNKKVH